jgi:hypothetical protein
VGILDKNAKEGRKFGQLQLFHITKKNNFYKATDAASHWKDVPVDQNVANMTKKSSRENK